MLFNALRFGAATSDRVDIGSGASISSLTAFSIVAWVYPRTLATGLFYTARKSTANGNPIYAFNITASGNIGTVVRTSGTPRQYTTNDTPLATTGMWYFVAVVYANSLSSNRGSLYSATVSAPPTVRVLGTNTDGTGSMLTDDTSTATWGNQSVALNLAFNGDIALGEIYSRALSLAELTQLWLNPKPISGCVNYMLMAENGNAFVRDRSGFGNHGIVTGAVPSFNPLPILNDDHQIAAIHRLRR